MSKTKLAQTFSSAKSVNLEEDRTLRVIATAPTLDRDLEVLDTKTARVPIKPRGWKHAADLTLDDDVDLPFLVDHDQWSGIQRMAGSVKKMFINETGELEAIVKLSTVDNGERVYTLAKEGHLGNSFSIGFSYQNATEDEEGIKNYEIVELSAVFKGSNRDARLLEVKSTKGNRMTSEEITAKKAELAQLTKDIADAETPDVEAPAVEEEVVEAPVVETEVEAVVEAEPETVEVPEAPVEEAKSIKKETIKMADTKGIVEAPELPVQEVKAVETKIDKYDFAAKQFVAFVNKDTKTLAELNQKAIESYRGASGSKATYLNTGVTADGGAIVPEAQLLADVYTTLGEFSSVANDLRVITLTEGNALQIASLVADVVMTEVETEGGTKPVTKPVFGQDELTLREFAGIAIITKKLVRQAAVNVFDILRESFARAIARERAQLALTDATSGIVNQVGVGVISQADELPTYAEIRTAPFQVPVAAVTGAKYYISREALEAIDGEINPVTGLSTEVVILDGEAGLSGRFRNGFRFSVEEELGGENPHVVFGAMNRFGILLRQGTVEGETFDTGIVVDGSAVSHNLLQQNKLAHRVAFYENVGYPLPGAFAVSEVVTS